MTALTVSPPNLTTWQPSAALWRLLSSGPKENISTLAAMHRAECEDSLRPLEVLCEPSDRRSIMAALAPLVLVFGKSAEAESPMFWTVYADALSDLPRVALDRAVQQHQREGRFFPKPAEIRAVAIPHAEALWQARFRASAALEPPAEPEPAREKVAPEAFASMMSEFRAKMEGKDIFARTRARQARTPSARVDETGMSAEMRAILEQRE